MTPACLIFAKFAALQKSSLNCLYQKASPFQKAQALHLLITHFSSVSLIHVKNIRPFILSLFLTVSKQTTRTTNNFKTLILVLKISFFLIF